MPLISTHQSILLIPSPPFFISPTPNIERIIILLQISRSPSILPLHLSILTRRPDHTGWRRKLLGVRFGRVVIVGR